MTAEHDRQPDHELLLVVRTLDRLATRVEAQFHPEMLESGDQDRSGAQLLDYVRTCREVLDDPAVIARLQAAAPRRW
ncbi:hypothetical protein D7D52_37090 [Nocardia yunnanensis]|uniref:Uncharacterized protein n=1 Tax=Nocardia yunnanensis TaxID=2382165 RepID=A0A386ZM51_9NOCA|nr:hypothetical protein [Nocardia yunnanensis]AYF78518.1 hypothetical protein D7D52_37090 [Nocardia yunnanensis]